MAIFEGAGVALVTPFKETGEINYSKLEELVEEQIAGGTDCIIVCGTTGESATMTHDEHIRTIQFVCDITDGRIPVVAGTGSNCTETSIYLSQAAQVFAGADGILLVTPYYNKSTQKGLKIHFSDIAGSVKIPAILYNILELYRREPDAGDDRMALQKCGEYRGSQGGKRKLFCDCKDCKPFKRMGGYLLRQ